MWFRGSDDVIRPHVRSTGAWEPEEGQLLRSLIRPGCRFLDVGANIGYFSLLAAAAAPQVTVDAIEPLPANLELLRFNLWYRGVPARIWPLALSDGGRAAVLSTSVTNPGDTRSRMDQLVGTRSPLVAPAASADELFPTGSFDVVKIDVQGSEPEVLWGMTGILSRSPGIVIVAEFWPHALTERGRHPLEVLDGYRRAGFEIVTQVGSHLAPLDDNAILAATTSAGPYGQVNLVLRRR
jgi:FkbM family methyltransferase